MYKNIGETPLEVLERSFSDDTPRTYCGRLDPMARGLLLVLEGEDCKKAKDYYQLTKIYEYKFAVGFSTDTYDLLGVVNKVDIPQKDITKEVKSIIDNLNGEIELQYPPYSSKTVNGIPLFEYAKNNKLNEITIPTKLVNIIEHIYLESTICNTKEIVNTAIENINKVNGDFRQKECIESLQALPNKKVYVFSVRATATSGTYIRSIVNHIGEKLNLPTVTIDINRIKIGDFDSVK